MNAAAKFVLPLVASCSMILASSATQAEKPQLVGIGSLPGTSIDKSPFTDTLSNGEPHNRFGGISALEYTGDGTRYIGLPDRGPDDGATGYLCRYQLLDIAITPEAVKPVTLKVLSTHLLSDEQGRHFTGDARQFEATDDIGKRLDPEGIRFAQNGTFWVSDEYGPQVIQFNSNGKAVRSFKLPTHLLAKHPAETKLAENALNTIGRSSNKGMEGLAISPDGTTLFGIMQSVLHQDGERRSDGKPIGNHCRLIQMDIATGTVREFAYPLSQSGYGLNEILALSATEFLVIERDGEAGDDAEFKKIMKINIASATNIVDIKSLPPKTLPSSIVPVQKEVFIDLLDPEYGLAGDAMPEKIEGLSFGPTLADGRRTFLIASDNDFEADVSTQVYVFAIEANNIKTTRIETAR